MVITPDGDAFAFEVDAHRKHCLLNGLDDIGTDPAARRQDPGVRERSASRSALVVQLNSDTETK